MLNLQHAAELKKMGRENGLILFTPGGLFEGQGQKGEGYFSTLAPMGVGGVGEIGAMAVNLWGTFPI